MTILLTGTSHDSPRLANKSYPRALVPRIDFAAMLGADSAAFYAGEESAVISLGLKV
jgi:hypothetical protein